MAPPGEAVRRRDVAIEWRVYREAMVVRGHFHPPGPQVHHRLVDAAMAVAQLVGAEAERPAEELIAEADAKEWNSCGQYLLQQRDLAGSRLWIARSVREEDTVRLERLDLGEGRGGRHHVHLDPALRHPERRPRL